MKPDQDSSQDSGTDMRRNRIAELSDQGRRAWRLLRDGRVPAWQKAIPVLTALYLVSPIDLLPEALVGPFGLVDDVVVVLLALKAFNYLAGPYAVDSRGAGDGADGEAEGPTIEVPYRPVE